MKKILCFLVAFGCLCYGIIICAGQQPLVFTSVPTYSDIAVDSPPQTYAYGLQNNTPVTMPLNISGISGEVGIGTGTNDCHGQIDAHANCNLYIQITPSTPGPVSQTLTIDYNNRLPLTSPIAFNVTGPTTGDLEIQDSQSSGPLYAYTAPSTFSLLSSYAKLKAWLYHSTLPGLSPEMGQITIKNTSPTLNVTDLNATVATQPAAGQVSILGGSCGSSLPPNQSCYYNYRYDAPSTPVGGSGIVGYAAAIRINYFNNTKNVVYPIKVFHIDKGHFITLPDNLPNYRGLPSANLNDVYVNSDGKRIYVATADAGIAFSQDAGATWETYNIVDMLGSNAVNNIFASQDGKRIYAATPNGLSVSTDGGASWFTYNTGNSAIGNNTINGVYAADNGSRLYAATGTGLAVSNNYGANWVRYTGALVINTNLSDVYANSDGSRIYVTSANNGAGGLAFTTNGGTSWSSVNSSGTSNLASNATNSVFASSDGQRIYVATTNTTASNGGISVSTSGGGSGTWATSNTTNGLGNNSTSGIYSSPDGLKLYAATSTGLSVSNDSGSHWATYTTGNGLGSNTVRRVFASDDGYRIYAATAGGLSFTTTGSQPFDNYTTINSLPNLTVNDVYRSNDGQRIYAATSGGLAISLDGGVTWRQYKKVNGLASDVVYSVMASGDGQIIYVGTDSGLSRSLNGGNSWTTFTTPQINGNIVRSVYVSVDGQKIYAGTNNTTPSDGGVSISFDGGGTWKKCTLSNKNTYHVYVNSRNYIYVASNPGGGGTGGVSVSLDDGGNWTSYSLPNNTVDGVYASADGNTIYAATAAGFTVSQNGGTDWRPLYTTIDGLATNNTNDVWASDDGQKVYVVSSGNATVPGGISVMLNGTTPFINYTTLNGGLPSFIVNRLYVSPDGLQIYAATAGGLAATFQGF